MPEIHSPTLYAIIAPSEITTIKHMAQQCHSFSDPEELWFLCYGMLPSRVQIENWLPILYKKKIILLYEDDLLGKIAAIKIACWLKRREVQISFEEFEMIQVRFNKKLYLLPEDKLSLSLFEKRTGFRSQIKTYKVVVKNLRH